MKKNDLFKAVGIVILLYVLFSWIVPIVYNGAEVSYQIGFVSILSVILETFSGFGTVLLYVFLVGAFYGVFKKTGAFDKVLELLSNKAKGREKGVLIGLIIVIALISSIVGLDLGFLVVYPLLIALVIKIGYDKFVAISATLGATIIGMYGATFANTLYGLNNAVLGLKGYDQILPKCILLVVGLIALIAFVLNYSRKQGFKFDKKKAVIKSESKKGSKVKKGTVKDSKNDEKVKTSKTKKSKEKKERTALPAIIIVSLLLLVLVLGTTAWEGIFGSNWFGTAHESWTSFKIGGFDILNKLFGGVDAFGTWNNPARFQVYSMLLLITMVCLVVIYRTKFDEAFEGFVDGIKEFVVPAILTILACSVFVFVYYNPALTPITALLLNATDDFNILLSGIYTIINSVFYVDYYYLAYSVLYNITSVYEDASVLSIISVMFANLYSLVMLVVPTSVLLLISLSISKVKYTEWLKFIWPLALVLLVISFIVFSVMLLV